MNEELGASVYIVTWTSYEECGFKIFNTKIEAEDYINEFTKKTGISPQFDVVYGQRLAVLPGRMTIESVQGVEKT